MKNICCAGKVFNALRKVRTTSPRKWSHGIASHRRSKILEERFSLPWLQLEDLGNRANRHITGFLGDNVRRTHGCAVPSRAVREHLGEREGCRVALTTMSSQLQNRRSKLWAQARSREAQGKRTTDPFPFSKLRPKEKGPLEAALSSTTRSIQSLPPRAPRSRVPQGRSATSKAHNAQLVASRHRRTGDETCGSEGPLGRK